MNIQYEYDRVKNFTRYHVAGVFKVNDVSAKILEVMEQVDLTRPYFDLWDIREVESSDDTGDLIWSMADVTRHRAAKKIRPQGRTALVADSRHIYGLSRMYEQLLQESIHWEHQVFTDVDQAVEWLFGT